MNVNLRRAALLLLAGLVVAGCDRARTVARGIASRAAPPFVIVSGSENEQLQPLVERFAREHGVHIEMKFKGSVDIMLDLEQGAQGEADAVWPANSLWVTLGDSQHVVRHLQSIFYSPVVFGIKQSVAQRLGWIGKDVRIADILAAAVEGRLRFAMTSASQSNSGAAAYLGFLHALAGSPQVLTLDDLEREPLQNQVRQLLQGVNRTSGSSGWLKDTMLAHYDQFDAMVNYESLIIEANQELLRRGQEPLYVVYPLDGIMMADSPLGYVHKGDAAKEEHFKALQAFLLSAPVQQEILALGRRTGALTFDPGAADAAVFNPAWGVDLRRVISPVPTPAEPVIRQALDLYQGGGLRKPSFTAYVLDFSGSMKGEGEAQLKAAMRSLLDPAVARRFLLQPSKHDVQVLVPFDANPRPIATGAGNDPAMLSGLRARVEAETSDGGTDMYAALGAALQAILQQPGVGDAFPAVVLMTDGRSQGDPATLQRLLAATQAHIPVFAITFGDADDTQLKQVAEWTGGRVFDGRKDLLAAFRKARGYN